MLFLNSNQVYAEAHDNATYYANQYLEPDSHDGYICPICGSGSGPNGTGLTLSENGRFTCWANAKSPSCFGKEIDGHCTGDIIDIIGAVEGLSDEDEKLKRFCQIFNISIQQESRSSALEDFKDVKIYEKPAPPKPKKESPAQVERKEAILKILKESLDGKPGKYSDLFKKAHSQLNLKPGADYIRSRGITENNPFFKYMGYLENVFVGNREFKGCIAFFGTNASYGVRDIYPVPEGVSKTMKPGGAYDIPTGILEVIKNKDKKLEGTNTPEPVFIVEGLFDAPSIAEVDAGADAIALNGKSIKPVILAFQEFDIKRPLLLALDNDAEGKKAQATAVKELEKTDIEFYEIPEFYKVSEILEFKDANEFLRKNKENLTKQVKKYKHLPVAEFEKTLNRSKKDKLKSQLEDRIKNPPIKTGFNVLDGMKFLDGGLYPGLYIIGAISSLGKTTFVLQLADQIAKSGQDVIFFSLEMPEIEIMGKSISRYTLKHLLESGRLRQGEKPDRNAKTLYDIYRNYTKDTDGVINEALDQYFKDTGDHLRIIEGIGNKNADDIAEEIKRHVNATGRTPVVFIDYLQLLIQPRDKRFSMTDKQITDANIFKLKQISRDFKTPIFGVSSFNRENYNEPVSMKSYKESGAIEYSSDVLIGLEPEYMGEKDKKARELQKQLNETTESETGIRKISLKILKNRNGYSGNTDIFDYYKKYNCYIERGNPDEISSFNGISF